MALPAAAEATVLTFGVPLKAASDPAEWLQLCGRLSDTVRSVYNQTNPAFQIVIACDRMPDLAFATDDRLEFLPVSSPVISTREEGDIDAGRKRWLIARWFTLGGGGYLMFLDADDLVSNRLVSFVHKTRHQSGYVFETGYGLSVATQSVLPIPQPGIADAPFHQMCGSSTIVLLSADDMDADNDGQSRFNRLFRRGHTTVAAAAKAEGRPMMKMPFPAAVYVLDTGLNLSLARAREEPDFAAEREQWRQAFRQTGFAIARIAREFGLTPALSRAKPWAAIRQASLASFSRAKAALDVAICGMPGRTIDFVRRRQRVHQPPLQSLFSAHPTASDRVRSCTSSPAARRPSFGTYPSGRARAQRVFICSTWSRRPQADWVFWTMPSMTRMRPITFGEKRKAGRSLRQTSARLAIVCARAATFRSLQ